MMGWLPFDDLECTRMVVAGTHGAGAKHNATLEMIAVKSHRSLGTRGPGCHPDRGWTGMTIPRPACGRKRRRGKARDETSRCEEGKEKRVGRISITTFAKGRVVAELVVGKMPLCQTRH